MQAIVIDSLKKSMGKISDYINSTWANQMALQNNKTTDLVLDYIYANDGYGQNCLAIFTSNGKKYAMRPSLMPSYWDRQFCLEFGADGGNKTGAVFDLQQMLKHRLRAQMNVKLNFALESRVVWPKLMIGGDPRQLKYQLQVRVTCGSSGT